MNNLLKQYRVTVAPKLKEELGYKNIMEVPIISKVVLNVGVGKHLKDKEYLKNVQNTLDVVTGQKSVTTKARKSISNFKIRDGMVVGVKVTLRGKKMWDFIEKLVKVTLPRVRDFRGISATAFDREGNYTLGMTEHTAFPEIRQDDVENVHGLEIIVKVDAKKQEDSKKLLTYLGFPFKKEITKK
jgi:large subunit ribosomal protein L5